MKRNKKYTERENQRYKTYLRKYRAEITKAAKKLKTKEVRNYAKPVSKETLIRQLRSSQLAGKRTSVTRIARENVLKGALTKVVFAEKLEEKGIAFDKADLANMSIREMAVEYGEELSETYQRLKAMGYTPNEAGSIISQEYFGS